MNHGRRSWLAADRLVYFSDAVVAIAITLLVLPLVDLVPEALAQHETTAEVLRENAGPIGAFLLSFVVIARLWTVHHSFFDGVTRVRRLLVAVDMFWLLTIVVLPFPTALTGAAGDDPDTARLYIGVLAANLVASTLLAWMLYAGYGEAEEPPGVAAVRGVGITMVLVVLAFVAVLLMPNPTFSVLWVLAVEPVVDIVWGRVRRLRA